MPKLTLNELKQIAKMRGIKDNRSEIKSSINE